MKHFYNGVTIFKKLKTEYEHILEIKTELSFWVENTMCTVSWFDTAYDQKLNSAGVKAGGYVGLCVKRSP